MHRPLEYHGVKASGTLMGMYLSTSPFDRYLCVHINQTFRMVTS